MQPETVKTVVNGNGRSVSMYDGLFSRDCNGRLTPARPQNTADVDVEEFTAYAVSRGYRYIDMPIISVTLAAGPNAVGPVSVTTGIDSEFQILTFSDSAGVANCTNFTGQPNINGTQLTRTASSSVGALPAHYYWNQLSLGLSAARIGLLIPVQCAASSVSYDVGSITATAAGTFIVYSRLFFRA